MLERERLYYEQHLAEWLTTYPGRFVLVKDDALVGVFDTNEDALTEGARRFGLESYLVRRVEPTPPSVTIPALSLGLLRADPAHLAHGASPDH